MCGSIDGCKRRRCVDKGHFIFVGWLTIKKKKGAHHQLILLGFFTAFHYSNTIGVICNINDNTVLFQRAGTTGKVESADFNMQPRFARSHDYRIYYFDTNAH